MIEVTGGSFINNNDGTITWTLPETNNSYMISIQAQKIMGTPSKIINKTINKI